jgi:hypothetical protein
MRTTIHAIALSVAGVVLASGIANAAPTIGANPNSGAGAVQKVQEFGIYIGPRYGYRDRYWDYGYGYGYGYNPDYYYAPRRYYYSDGYRYRDERRPFRRLERRAP